ncbi:hypothetical protein GW17_00007989 [Ensete ventricosum]|nr:hypothetical protein GW17_00007989 [Ensete ventricosum]
MAIFDLPVRAGVLTSQRHSTCHPMQCTDSWYTGAYRCFNEEEKEVKEEGSVEEQRTKKEEGRRRNKMRRRSAARPGKQWQHRNAKRQWRCSITELCKHFRFQWPVNVSVKRISCVSSSCQLYENKVCDRWFLQTVHALRGHLDFSFASAWNPDGQTFATGNQDKTCRIWDIRNLSKSVSVLRGNLGAIRSIRFTSDGRFMAMAEPADFVHIFDVRSGYNKRQELDFFGEISGMSFSPDTEALFVGVWDRTYGSLLQYSRLRNYSYFDSLL